MGLLKKVTGGKGYSKIGVFGETGCGKSTTAFLIAVGILDYFKIKNRTIAYFDTENAVGWLKGLADAANVDIVASDTRAFADIGEVMREARDSDITVVCIDSITAPWRELVTSVKGSKSYISMQDWGMLKDLWNSDFALPFVNSELHILMCGRSGNVFEDVEVDGKETMKKVGTKMASEKETGHEPDLLIEMERQYNNGTGKYSRKMSVIKDRSRAIDGRTQRIENMKDDADIIAANVPWKFVFPHMSLLTPGAAPKIDTSRTSAALVADSSGAIMKKEGHLRDVQVEEIKVLMARHFPGSTVADKKAKADLMHACFETANWSLISTQMDYKKLEHGVQQLGFLLSPELTDGRMIALSRGISGDGKTIDEPDAAVDALRELLQPGEPMP